MLLGGDFLESRMEFPGGLGARGPRQNGAMKLHFLSKCEGPLTEEKLTVVTARVGFADTAVEGVALGSFYRTCSQKTGCSKGNTAGPGPRIARILASRSKAGESCSKVLEASAEALCKATEVEEPAKVFDRSIVVLEIGFEPGKATLLGTFCNVDKALKDNFLGIMEACVEPDGTRRSCEKPPSHLPPIPAGDIAPANGHGYQCPERFFAGDVRRTSAR